MSEEIQEILLQMHDWFGTISDALADAMEIDTDDIIDTGQWSRVKEKIDALK
jgi:hypothetical protein